MMVYAPLKHVQLLQDLVQWIHYYLSHYLFVDLVGTGEPQTSYFLHALPCKQICQNTKSSTYWKMNHLLL